MVEAVETQAVEHRERSYAQMVVLVPGIAALGLALLYATGALIKTAQLRDAEVRVQDTLPLVPIEQILALGIGTIVSSLAIVVVWAATILVIAYFARRKQLRGDPPPTPVFRLSPKHYRRFQIGMLIIGAILVLWLLTFDPLFSVVAVMAPAFAMGFAFAYKDRGEPRRVVLILGIAYLLVVAARVADNWYSSPPLAEVTIETRDGMTVEGSLIVARGDSWYVTSAPGKVELVPASRIVTATVTKPEPEEDEPAIPLWDWIG